MRVPPAFKRNTANIALAAAAAVFLFGCSDGNLESFTAKAMKAAQNGGEGFEEYVDQPTLRSSFLARGYSKKLIDEPTSPASPHIVSIVFGGRDQGDAINLHYVRNETETSGEYVIQCINNPRSSLVFKFKKFDGKWKFVDYEQLTDPDGAFGSIQPIEAAAPQPAIGNISIQK